MKSVIFISTALMLIPLFSNAEGTPLIGNEKADSHQLCGKNILLQIKEMDNGFLIIGLINNKTTNMDFFKSIEHTTSKISYTKYTPTKFDVLSNTFIDTNNPDLDILWGSSLNDKKQMTYNLVLGSKVYECGPIQKWPNETANLLYGDVG